ncbi:hypothetical protein JTB14_036417 [Gonioctena quinquepunctata]|nr:hypothetical protein JTB14_036417 [Gonioctena quinquepunctata]
MKTFMRLINGLPYEQKLQKTTTFYLMTQRSVSTDLTRHADYGQSSTELEQVAGNVLIPYTNGAGQNPHNMIVDLRGKLSATSYQNVLTGSYDYDLEDFMKATLRLSAHSEFLSNVAS